MYPVIEWKDNSVYMIDQRLLPLESRIVKHDTYQEVAASIKDMVVRGAPAIGVAAAMGVAIGVLKSDDPAAEFDTIAKAFASTRPTAVNLFWAIERMRNLFNELQNAGADELKRKMVEEAIEIDREDVEINRLIGKNGEHFFEDGFTVLTHCNAGALATAGYGTALGVVRAAVEKGKNISVYADETRPYLQGARLTVWELQEDNIPVTLITDNMAAHVMKKGMIDAIVVGADRIAANGDSANKIGTYGLAVLAKHHNIPIYFAAPLSTIDFDIETGEEIPIEERPREEVINFRDQQIARDETKIFNPSFDVTPAELITAIITEKGAVKPSEVAALKKYVK